MHIPFTNLLTENFVKKTFIALAALAALSAYAGNNVPGNCGQGSGHGKACQSAGGTNTNANTNHVANKVTNTNSNSNHNASSSRSKSRSTSSATGGSSRSHIGNIAPTQTSTNAASNAGNNTVLSQNYEAQERNPVNTAYAAPLTATNGTCMGSSTGGLSFPSFGISGGSTWNDVQCNRRYNAIMLTVLGHDKAAVALMCQDPMVREAMAAAGTNCPETQKTAPIDTDYKGNDPYVLDRLSR